MAFVAGFKRATDEGSLPENAQYSPYYLALNVFYCFQRITPLYLFLVPLNLADNSVAGSEKMFLFALLTIMLTLKRK